MADETTKELVLEEIRNDETGETARIDREGFKRTGKAEKGFRFVSEQEAAELSQPTAPVEDEPKPSASKAKGHK